MIKMSVAVISALVMVPMAVALPVISYRNKHSIVSLGLTLVISASLLHTTYVLIQWGW